MNLKQLYVDLKQKGVLLYVEDGKLKSKSQAGAITPEIAQLVKENKEGLITLLSQQTAAIDAKKVTKVAPQPHYPLSFSQQRLWFLDELDGSTVQFNMPAYMGLKGKLDIAAMQYALNQFVSRHEVLRTTFEKRGGEGVQIVNDAKDVPIEFVDLTEHEQSKALAIADQEVKKSVIHPFDLSNDLMLRVSLFQVAPQEYRLLLVVHHIASDGWSVAIMVKEMMSFYHAYISNTQAQLPELEVQYSDYAVWQREHLSGDTLERQMQFWKQYLDGIPQVHSLPLDRPRPAMQEFEGGVYQQLLGPVLSDKLNALAKKLDVTLFMLMQSAFALTLSRWSNEMDIVMGTPIAGRTKKEIEPLIGFFVNTLVLRTQFDPNESFADMLTRTRDQMLEVFSYQETPLELLVDMLQHERSLSYAPVLQIDFSMQNNEKAELSLPELEITSEFCSHWIGKNDLDMAVFELEDGLFLKWGYALSIFDGATIERMAQTLESILLAVVEQPDCLVFELPIMPAQAKQALLSTPKRAHSEFSGIHQWIEQVALKQPNEVAVVCDGQSVTYQQLNEQANQVAHYLINKGVETSELVGICVERSIEMIVSVCGVLKAGAAYVPLDPSYPEDRLEHMLEDSEVNFVLTQKHLMTQMPFESQTTVLMDQQWRQLLLKDMPVENPQGVAHDLAYVIYTSGSTGMPKGVKIAHKQLIASTESRHSYYEDTLSAFLLMSSLSFDSSVAGLFWSLTSGGKLVIPTGDEIDSVAELIELIQYEQVSHLLCVPSYYHILLDALVAKDSAVPLKVVISAGEALPSLLVNAHLSAKIMSDCKLYNEYGPTEGTVWSTVYLCDSIINQGSVPIGMAPSHADLLVLDNEQRVLPVGAVGELYIAGAGVCEGYLNQPQLNAEKFITHPLSDTHNVIYKTGDLVRYKVTSTGRLLEYLGRIDDQVKIRGFRIELGEIEAQIESHDQVEQAVVVDIGESNNKKLVAYYTVKAGVEVDEESFNKVLRVACRQALPDYMVPVSLLKINDIPLTSNGKINKDALPKVDVKALFEHKYVAPSTDEEKLLCEIWQEYLKVDEIGVEDNFFALGGDSILSIQIVSKANQVGLQVTTKQIFDLQTIALVAEQASFESAVEFNQQAITEPLNLTPIQHAFLESHFDTRHHYNQSLLFKVPQTISSEQLQKVMSALVIRHDVLRLRFEQAQGAWQGVYNHFSEPWLNQHIIEQTLPVGENADAQLTAACDEYQQQLNIETGPLFKVVLFSAQDESRLLLAFHHLIIDGVSWRILLADLEAAYEQVAQGEQITLGAKTSAFNEWGEQLHGLAKESRLLEEKAFWLEQVSASECISLPLKEDAQLVATEQSNRHIGFELDKEQTEHLLRRCPSVYRTQIQELLVSALYLGYKDWCQQDNMLLTLEGHGRDELANGLDVSQTLGWFTALYPLTVKQEVSDVSHIIRGVKEQLRSIPNNGRGYGILRYINKDEELAKYKLVGQPNILFNYLGQFDQSFSQDSAFQLAAESAGQAASSEQKNEYMLGVRASVFEGTLRFTLDYSCEQFDESVVQALADAVKQQLQVVIEHCVIKQQGEFTPSDFPLASVSMEQLDEWQSRYEIEKLYPATAMQQGLHYHSVLDASSYVVQIHPKLIGKLNTANFKQAWQQICQRYDIFRTALLGSSDNMHQLVLKNVELPWFEADWRGLSKREQEDKFEAYRKQDKANGFDFSQAPLQRIALFRVKDDEYRLLWTHHHAIIDGWCSPLVYRDVMKVYEGLQANKVVDLPKAPMYEDYIKWLASRSFEDAGTFWRSQLGEFKTPTPLVFDDVNHQGVDQFKEFDITLDETQTKRLQAFAQANGTTVNTLLQLAWSYVLHYYSGESDVVFGATISGRPAEVPNIDSMVGLFINSIPVKVSVDRQMKITDWVKQAARNFSACNEYGYLPLTDIRAQSQVSGQSPLFNSLILFQNFPMDPATEINDPNNMPSVTLAEFETNEQTNYPLSLGAALRENFVLSMSYNNKLFSDACINRVLSHLVNVLEQLPEAEYVSDLVAMSEQEQNLLLDWTYNPVQFAHDSCVHEVFEQLVLQRQDAPALCFEDETLSYNELNDRANQLGHYLRSKGVKVGDVVGLCIERSADMIVAMLGILKAGGAYLPLDPSYPAERLAYMIDDADVEVVVTTKAQLEDVELHDQVTVLMDPEFQKLLLDKQPTSNLPKLADLNASSLAYLIYTSGTTGEPKGVMLAHKGAVNLACEQVTRFDVSYQSRVLHFASISFDAGTWDWLMGLLSGATLYVCSQECRQSAQLLSEMLEKSEITHATLPPALLPHLDFTKQYQFTSLIIAGEACDENIAWKWASKYPLYNAYGPTEGTVCACVGKVIPGEKIHIGTPLANVSLYVLDEAMHLVPAGVAGELYIAGVGVAAGYWGKPELTESAFVKDLFSTHSNARMYRTGDRVRLLPDEAGQPTVLEFLGRNDNQVKIRGFRVELNEISNQMSSLQQVRESVVVTHGKQDARQLVAYFTSDLSLPQEELVEQIRFELQERLPNYMIPAAFMLVDALPLNANGKVDKSKLPKFESIAAKEFVLPCNITEEKLLDIWQSLLSNEHISVDDNFFNIGGQSLLAMRLAMAIENTFSVSIALNELFDAPTIKELAELIGARDDKGKVEIAPQARDGLLPLSFAQQRLWVIDQLEGESAQYNIPIAVKLKGRTDVNALQYAVDKLVARHEILRTNFVEHDGQASQTISKVRSHNIKVIDLTNQPFDKADGYEDIIKQECNTPFNLEKDSLLRCALVKLTEQEHLLLFTIHHIVTDGWSNNIMVQEFISYYSEFVTDSRSEFEPLAIQYADYAVWQREQISGQRKQQALDFWTNTLNGIPQVHSLPLDKRRPAAQQFDGGQYQMALSKSVSRSLQHLSRKQKVTMFMLMETAFVLFLGRWSRENDIVVGTPIAGRNNAKLDPLIGFFVNQLVLRTQLPESGSFSELLDANKTSILEAFNHQEIPFEMLVDALQPARSLSHSPICQVTFSLDTKEINRSSATRLPDLEIEALLNEGRLVKNDLSLDVFVDDEQILLSWDYATSLFTQKTIERMACSFEVMLASISQNPLADIRSIAMVTQADLEQIAQWNNHPRGKENLTGSVIEAFEAQVNKAPNACALQTLHQVISYEELNRKANQFARLLSDNGISAGDKVGLSMRPRVELLVAIFATLKLGAAYLPVDAATPLLRKQFIINDSEVALWLSDEDESFDNVTTLNVITEKTEDTLASLSDTELAIELNNTQSAVYYIYTSGSTGQPKGVEINQQNLCSYVEAAQEHYHITQNDKILQFSSISFDIFAEEVFCTLLNGGVLVIGDNVNAMDSKSLLRFVAGTDVTQLSLPTAYWHLMVREIEEQHLSLPSCVRLVVIGGEEMSLSLLSKWQKHVGGDVQLINAYGPTECTISTTFYDVENMQDEEEMSALGSPIGQSTSNNSLYVMDENTALRPIGAVGELCVSGKGVTPGYLNRSLLNKEKFVSANMIPEYLTGKATILAVFESFTAFNPTLIACGDEQDSLTYDMLNSKANQLVREVLSTGPKPQRVAIYCHRQVDYVVAILACWKMGSAYVPLDPSMPKSRLSYILDDSDTALILTQQSLVTDLSFTNVPILAVDGDVQHKRDDRNIDINVCADDTAYIIYTSGSTGNPKGVAISHRSLLNLGRNIYLYISQQVSCWGLTAPFSFDSSLKAITGMCFGCKLFIVPQELKTNIDRLVSLKCEQQIELFDCTPSLVCTWLQSEEAVKLPNLIIGGEEIQHGLWKQLVQWQAQNAKWAVNVYGPTEACVNATWTRIEGEYPHIGKNLDSVTTYISNSKDEMVPIGALGELYIGGEGVAQGYVNNDALTAERFLQQASERLYKTGDLVRYLPDGNLVYVGRTDDMVKIRGYRIELGEVKALLMSLAQVKEAVVVTDSHVSHKRLLAYVVIHEDGERDVVSQIKYQLRQIAPDYLIPSVIMPIAKVPLTTNGKVDVKALPAIDESSSHDDYVAPSNEVEKVLCDVIQSLLGLEKVGAHDNFFMIGGDSILSIQAVSRARARGIYFSPRDLFEHQTVAELALVATQEAVVEFEQGSVTGEFELIPIHIEALARVNEPFELLHHYNMSVLMSSPGGMSHKQLRDVVSAIYQRHDAFRLRFSMHQEEMSAEYQELTQKMIDESALVIALSDDAADDYDFIASHTRELHKSLRLDTGPIMRMVYFTAPDRGYMFIVSHHAVIDGISWRILLNDLSAAYSAVLAEEDIQLEKKSSSYQQWSKRLKEYSGSEQLKSEKSFWLAQVPEDLPGLPVELDSDEVILHDSMSTVDVSISAEDTESLIRKCPSVYDTRVEELILCGVYKALSQWKKDKKCQFLMESHGREDLFSDIDLSQTVGWFTASYPLLIEAENEGIEALINQVKQQYQAVPNHGIGYGLLRYLQQDSDLVSAQNGQMPEFVFNYLGQFDQTMESQAHDFRYISIDTGEQMNPQRKRPYLMSLEGSIAGGNLSFLLTYSTKQYSQSYMQALAQSIESAIVEVIHHCVEQTQKQYN